MGTETWSRVTVVPNERDEEFGTSFYRKVFDKVTRE